MQKDKINEGCNFGRRWRKQAVSAFAQLLSQAVFTYRRGKIAFGADGGTLLGIAKPEDIIIVTNKDYIYHVQAELKEAKAEAAQIITEPVGRNTAPAIALAMAYIKSCGADKNETVFISPADHLIKPAEVFQQIVLNAQSLTADDK